jgi:hypothetical protein
LKDTTETSIVPKRVIEILREERKQKAGKTGLHIGKRYADKSNNDANNSGAKKGSVAEKQAEIRKQR